MANVATLAVSLIANTNNYTRGLSQARRQTDDFVGHLGNIRGKITGVLAGVGISLGVRELISGLRETADNIGNLANKADSIGISTEALARFNYAAKLSDVSTEALSASLVKMRHNILNARDSGADAAESLRAMGFDLDTLAQMDAEQQFLNIAEAISRIPSIAERGRIAIDIFGKSGVNLLSMLKGGAAALQELGQEMDSFGGSVDRVSAEKIIEMNDALEKLDDVWDGIKTTVVIKVAPAVTDLVDRLRAMVTAGDDFGAKFEAALMKVLGVADKLLVKLGAIKNAFMGTIEGARWLYEKTGEKMLGAAAAVTGSETIGAWSQGFGEAAAESRRALEYRTERMKLARAARNGSGDAAEQLKALDAKREEEMAAYSSGGGRSGGTLSRIAGGIVDWWEGIQAGADERARAAAAVAEERAAIDAALDQAKENEKKMAEIEKFALKVKLEVATPEEQYNAEMTKLNEALNAGALGWDIYNRAVSAATDKLHRAIKSLRDLRYQMDRGGSGDANKIAFRFSGKGGGGGGFDDGRWITDPLQTPIGGWNKTMWNDAQRGYNAHMRGSGPPMPFEQAAVQSSGMAGRVGARLEVHDPSTEETNRLLQQLVNQGATAAVTS